MLIGIFGNNYRDGGGIIFMVGWGQRELEVQGDFFRVLGINI